MGNGLVERYNRKIKEIIRACVDNNPTSWDEYIDCAAFTLRATTSRATCHSPAEMVFGSNIRLPVDIIFSQHLKPVNLTDSQHVMQLRKTLKATHDNADKNIEKYQQYVKKNYDKKCTDKFYDVGDHVMVSKIVRRKLEPLYERPYVVTKKKHPVYELKTIYHPEVNQKCHFNRLIPCNRPAEGSRPNPGEYRRQPP
ncbi:Retrovirus-related Pol polyprotein [Thelohanellus kitauei]|uniref:Retrovirus-related Pol polyprotein n=1 Tax=Thelohanellus kitauei TaxID=669202 RepID=A0A0C2MIX9_THEKT|nr:Retrovirus-related Pol polyprotein [Thelohanellus kitauei]